MVTCRLNNLAVPWQPYTSVRRLWRFATRSGKNVVYSHRRLIIEGTSPCEDIHVVTFDVNGLARSTTIDHELNLLKEDPTERNTIATISHIYRQLRMATWITCWSRCYHQRWCQCWSRRSVKTKANLVMKNGLRILPFWKTWGREPVLVSNWDMLTTGDARFRPSRPSRTIVAN